LRRGRRLPLRSAGLLPQSTCQPVAISGCWGAGPLPLHGPEQLYAAVQRAVDWDQWLPPQRSFSGGGEWHRPVGSATSPIHGAGSSKMAPWSDCNGSGWGDAFLNRPGPFPISACNLQLSAAGSGAPASWLGRQACNRRGLAGRRGLAPLKKTCRRPDRLTGWMAACPWPIRSALPATLLIEAGLRAWGVPRALGRVLALRHLADFDGPSWRAERAAAPGSCRSAPGGEPLGAGAWGWSANLPCLEQGPQQREAAGMAPWLDLQPGDLPHFSGRQPNPGVESSAIRPYGERLGGGEDLEALPKCRPRAMAKERARAGTLWACWAATSELTGALADERRAAGFR